ncbi:zinc metalloprotease [Telluribacter sp. SYSU D00476]|uniref:zinc metalloprotease n=1 Tax=Telluribacter sp. SYSU D00476 TaxID=2811430 RepID=UPI001FF298F0|nr:zinc metalloprotease [Telluribacter sp. SYSU D00476]
MKPIYNVLFAAVSMTMVLACSENQFENEATLPDKSVSARLSGQGNDDKCATMKVLEEKIKENPGLAKKLEAIEAQTQRFASNQKNGAGTGKPGGGTGGDGGTSTPYTGTVTIPVYIHVIYNTSVQNISDAQIQSQINVLNADFNKTNSDISKTPSEFSGTTSSLDIQFTWNTANTVRKASSKTSWGTRDDMKYSRKGGSDAVPGYLNIWVCNIGGGILGYAQFPGGSASTDGVVIGPNYFGKSETGKSYYLSAPYDLGRTATHEVGHWLNLRHIWGDGGCGVDDYVADTPMSDSPNYGCPSYPTIKCSTSNMTMNYMDYTNDACMYMFTSGQKTRTRALFASDGARRNFVTVTP